MPLQWNPFTGNFQVPFDPTLIAFTGFPASHSGSLVVGDIVVFSTTADNTVEKVTSNNYDTRLAVGVVVSVSGTDCFVAERGRLDGIASGLVRSKTVYVSPTGTLTTTIPTSGDRQVIGIAYSATGLQLNIATRKNRKGTP